MIASRLKSETEASLAKWFIDEYIRKTAAEICPEHILRLFEDRSSRTSLQNAVSQVVNWRLERLSGTKARDMYTVHNVLTFIVSLLPPSRVQSCILMMRRFANIDQHVYLYFTASIILHIAYKTTRDQLTDELLDILYTTYLLSNDRRR